MQAITRFFVDRWQFTAILFFLLIALGIGAIVNIPKAEDPIVEFPGVEQRQSRDDNLRRGRRGAGSSHLHLGHSAAAKRANIRDFDLDFEGASTIIAFGPNARDVTLVRRLSRDAHDGSVADLDAGGFSRRDRRANDKAGGSVAKHEDRCASGDCL